MKALFFVRITKQKLNALGENYKYVRACIEGQFYFVRFRNCAKLYNKLKVDYNYKVKLYAFEFQEFKGQQTLWVSDFEILSERHKQDIIQFAPEKTANTEQVTF